MNKIYNKLVVFDFDGVVCDSTNECMVTAWNAWERWNGGTEFRNSLDFFNAKETELFRDLRPYVRGAGEYYLVMRIINSNEPYVFNQKQYDHLLKKEKQFIKPFKGTFYKERERLRKFSIDNWISLHVIYEDVVQVLKGLHNQERLIVATLKDKESVCFILENEGIKLKDQDVLDESKIESKFEALEKICKFKKITKDELIFFDDNVTHLIEPHDNGYNVFLTTWGNTLKEHIVSAHKKGIKHLDNLEGLDLNV